MAKTTRISKKTVFKTYLVNVETLGAMCGYGSGLDRADSAEDALRIARETDPAAWLEAGQVYFRGGVNR